MYLDDSSLSSTQALHIINACKSDFKYNQQNWTKIDFETLDQGTRPPILDSWWVSIIQYVVAIHSDKL